MNISIVIPNYNGEDLLRKNLPKVFEAIDFYKGKKEVIVADDASVDDSISLLRDMKGRMDSIYPDINFRIVQNEKNLGFSSNVNLGVGNASGDILILLNTDVVTHKDFLRPLLSHFEDPYMFAVGCMDESIENDKKILRGRGIGFWRRGFLVHGRGEVDKANTLWVSCGSGAFRKTIWDKLGGLDTLYSPFYWEDIDISYRALKRGYKILFEPKSVVTHEHEKGAIKNSFTLSHVKAIAYRNQFIFVWKNIADFSMQFEHLFWLPYHIFSAVIRRDLAFFSGLFRAIAILPRVIAESFKAQILFKIKDREILGKFMNEK